MIRISAFSDEAAADLAGQIAALRRNGIPYTDIRNIDGVNVGIMTETTAKAHARTLADAGIGVWMIGSPLGKVDIDVSEDKLTDDVKHICELAGIFGTDKVRIFSFFNAYDKADRVVALLSLMVETARGYGVTLCHENEKHIYGDTLERVTELMTQVSGLRFIYDPANYIQTEQDPHATTAALVGKTDYFHIKDVIAATGEVVPAGEGDGLIPQFLSDIEGDTVLTLEPHLKIFGGYASIDETALRNKYTFGSNDEAFDFAAAALKRALVSAGYRERDGKFIKQ